MFINILLIVPSKLKTLPVAKKMQLPRRNRRDQSEEYTVYFIIQPIQVQVFGYFNPI